VLRGEVLAADGSWVQLPFLVDTAADRTVFSADILATLCLPTTTPPTPLRGVGGAAASVLVHTQIQLSRDDGGQISLQGHYAAFTDLESLDMSVLGRDITNLFAIIIDRPRDFVCLLSQRHSYLIQVK
jgi:hypothetical protein